MERYTATFYVSPNADSEELARAFIGFFGEFPYIDGRKAQIFFDAPDVKTATAYILLFARMRSDVSYLAGSRFDEVLRIGDF